MADSEDLPDQEPVHRKSKALIALQLMKRWRNIQYDKREGRRPPSVMMSKLIADAANSTDTLSEELLHQAKVMQAELNRWHRAGQLICVANPVCLADVLTDRWPGSLDEQAIFIRDLDDLVVKVERLLAGCSLRDMQRIMTHLFGEAPTGDAFEAYNQQAGTAIRDGKSRHTRDGGRLILPASGIVTGVKVACGPSDAEKHLLRHGEARKLATMLTIRQQIALMHRFWPDFDIQVQSDWLVSWKGQLRPFHQTYLVRVFYYLGRIPQGYPDIAKISTGDGTRAAARTPPRDPRRPDTTSLP